MRSHLSTIIGIVPLVRDSRFLKVWPINHNRREKCFAVCTLTSLRTSVCLFGRCFSAGSNILPRSQNVTFGSPQNQLIINCHRWQLFGLAFLSCPDWAASILLLIRPSWISTGLGRFQVSERKGGSRTIPGFSISSLWLLYCFYNSVKREDWNMLFASICSMPWPD